MALLVNSLADAIKQKDADKFNGFLERACCAAGSQEDSLMVYNSLKELLGKASIFVANKLQKGQSEKAVQDMKKATSSVDYSDDVMIISETTAISSSSSDSGALNLPNCQFLEPRGRFEVSITSTGLLLQGKQSVFVPWSKVTHVARVPSHTSTKKEGEDVLAIRLSEDGTVLLNGKPLKSLLWVLSNLVRDEGCESDIATKKVESFWKNKIGLVNRSIFQTITQKCFLRCYNGLQEGGLYPLKCGVIFIKPLVFVPLENIASVSAGRGGGTGNTRYVDLKIETTDDKLIEFTNIEREELACLQSYVKNYLEVKARQRAVVSAPAQQVGAGSDNAVENFMQTNFGDEDDDDDDEEDEDFDPDGMSDEGGGDGDDDASGSSEPSDGDRSDDDSEGGSDSDDSFYNTKKKATSKDAKRKKPESSSGQVRKKSKSSKKVELDLTDSSPIEIE